MGGGGSALAMLRLPCDQYNLCLCVGVLGILILQEMCLQAPLSPGLSCVALVCSPACGLA